MPNVYFAGFFAVLILLGLGGAYVKGGNDREARIVVAQQARDLKAAADYQAKETALQNEYRAKEQGWQEKFVSQARTYEGKVKDNAKALDIALTSGRLYDRFAATNPTCGDSTAKTPANPITISQAGAEFFAEADRFFKSEAARANKVVLDLNLCIGVLESERQ